MMKKITKIVAMAMAITCLVNSEYTVFAEGSTPGIGGAYISDESYVDSNDYVKFQMIEKDNGIRARVGMQMLSSSITRYEQENIYYCVPATMQTILAYINETTPPTQDYIAASMGFIWEYGVDFLEVPDFLNSNQSQHDYVMHSKSSEDAMTLRINADITRFGVPTSIRIQVSDSSEWFYTTQGHALVCAGINSDLSSVYLMDPGVGYTAYIKSTSDLYNVFTHLAW